MLKYYREQLNRINSLEKSITKLNKKIKKKKKKKKQINTVTNNYFILIQNEYNIERNKKQSFENRAGILLTVYGAILIYLLQDVKLVAIIDCILLPLNFMLLIKIISGICVYIFMLLSLLQLAKVITVGKYSNFGIEELDENLIFESELIGTARIIKSYKLIIEDYRLNNNRKAKTLRWAIRNVIIVFLAYITFINC